MGRVIGVLALGAAVVACEPRPTELYIPREGNDWILILSEAREQLIHRNGDVFQSSKVPEPFSSEIFAMDSIALTEADGVGLVSRFGDRSVLGFDRFAVREDRLAPELEVVSAARASQARCRCSAPQFSGRTLVVAGAACALPQPKQTYEFAAGPGSFTDRKPAVEASGQRFLLESSIDGECDVFLGTERLVGEQARPPLQWGRAVGLPKAEQLEGLCLAGGEDDLLVAREGSLEHQAKSGAEFERRSEWRYGPCLAVASMRAQEGDRGFWGLVQTATTGVLAVELRRERTDDSSLKVERQLQIGPSAFTALNSAPTMWHQASPKAILSRGARGNVGLFEPDPWGGATAELRFLPEAVHGQGELRLPTATGLTTLASSKRGSSWIAWQGDEGLGLAWVLPVAGEESATLFEPPGAVPGAPGHVVALAEDRLVLLFRTESGPEAWEWVQLPLRAAHPYDAACDRVSGSFCFRPFPTTDRLDGKIPCETSAEIAHAWAEPSGLAVVYEDGHTWRSGSLCDREPGLAPVRGASTDGGRTLLLDQAGDFWLTKEDP